jgi:Domain of unknown function (DUF4082)
LFSPSATPSAPEANDPNPVELGVKFQTSVPGTVTAIRFYKSVHSVGNHIGNLWSSTGALLATGTFINETSSGWQQVQLATPVTLTAATTYTVSYHSNAYYMADASYFSSAHSNGPLAAGAGSNGVYAYGQTSAFPVSTYNTSNYWVDVVFQPTQPSQGGAITPAPVIDAKASRDQGTANATVMTGAFSTTSGNELLLAFVATDYLSGANTTVTQVTGAGLNWSLVVRTNVQEGTSEIWRAFATSVLLNVNVTATLSQSVASSITVASFKGVDTSGTNGSGAIGATGTGNAFPGAPSAGLVTTRNNSLVLAVGNDYDAPIARTPASNQSVLHQYLAPTGDTYWVQMLKSPTAWTGTSVTINDTAPTLDRFNLSLCEVLPVK